MFSAVETNWGKVLNSWDVASEDLTTNNHGYSFSESKSAINVSSLTGSSTLPDPALAWLTTELAGTINVGILLGITAVDGREAVGLVLVAGWLVTGAAVVVPADDEAVLLATINQVCEGV